MTIIKEPMYHYRVSGDEQVASHRDWTAKVERPDMAERMVEVIRDMNYVYEWSQSWTEFIGHASFADPAVTDDERADAERFLADIHRMIDRIVGVAADCIPHGDPSRASVGGLRVALGALVRLDELSQVITCPAGD